jgi:putative membrane protein
MFDIFIAIVTGICFGIITGLIPGIHINLVVTFLLAGSATLLNYTSPLVASIFIISLSTTHQFLEFIPSIFLGAPNPSTALSVLPGHRYLLKGYGLMAVKLGVIGCLFGILLSAVLVYPIILILPTLFTVIKRHMLYFLIAIIIMMLYNNRRKVWATLIFAMSGIVGLIVFSIPNVREPLFPLLSGLFGTATLIYSLKDDNHIPEQKKYTGIKLERGLMWKAVGVGQISALSMSLFPGMSPAIAALFGMQLVKKLGDHGYMILQGCINAAGFVLSIVTFYVIDKARNGAIVGVQKLLITLNTREMIILTVTAVTTAAIAVPLTIGIARLCCTLLNKINYKKLIIGIICFITTLVFIMSGWIGLLILITTTAIGLLPAATKVTRTTGMGCLLLPVVVYLLI